MTTIRQPMTFRDEANNRASAPKWLEKKKFIKQQSNDKKCFHSNKVTLFSKVNKPDSKWYFKRYKRSTPPYEYEACASDFYRFILGKERAAKAQAVSKYGNIVGIISQHNPAGFESILDITNKPGLRNFALTPRNGYCEVEMAEAVLNEVDGVDNPGNVGFNRNDEISRIDYNLSFFYGTAFIGNLSKNESLIHDTKDDNVIQRFYKAALKIIMLNDDNVIKTILERHVIDPKIAAELSRVILMNTKTLRQDFMQSERFKTFMLNFDNKELFIEIEDFFKHERTHASSRFDDCLASIKATYAQITAACTPSKATAITL
ncbi:MAG: hypothetical protein H0W64_01240 [Gammaproteobacteria bacterium]|nr:hypothetical protein [Gammaproteobacteria bacterium]